MASSVQGSDIEMHPSSFSGFPIEIFDEILSWLADESPQVLAPLLLLNKSIAPRIVKLIYRKADPIPGNEKRSDLLFKTLLSNSDVWVQTWKC